MSTIVYLKSCRRQPVQTVPSALNRDYEADIPASWCIGCCREVYTKRGICRRCSIERGRSLWVQ